MFFITQMWRKRWDFKGCSIKYLLIHDLCVLWVYILLKGILFLPCNIRKICAFNVADFLLSLFVGANLISSLVHVVVLVVSYSLELMNSKLFWKFAARFECRSGGGRGMYSAISVPAVGFPQQLICSDVRQGLEIWEQIKKPPGCVNCGILPPLSFW